MDVTSLYTNIPQEEGITAVCRAYENFHRNNPPIPTQYLRERLILKENSFQFNGKNYLQIHSIAMGTKMAVAFANIFMADIETHILSNSVVKPTIWKRYIDDIFSLWDVSKPDIDKFIEQANSHHPTIKSCETCALFHRIFTHCSHSFHRVPSSIARMPIIVSKDACHIVVYTLLSKVRQEGKVYIFFDECQWQMEKKMEHQTRHW